MIVHPITPREMQVLTLMADGLTQAETAARLRISSWMVHNHRKSIYLKLRAHRATQAVAIARREGLLP